MYFIKAPCNYLISHEWPFELQTAKITSNISQKIFPLITKGDSLLLWWVHEILNKLTKYWWKKQSVLMNRWSVHFWMRYAKVNKIICWTWLKNQAMAWSHQPWDDVLARYYPKLAPTKRKTGTIQWSMPLLRLHCCRSFLCPGFHWFAC